MDGQKTTLPQELREIYERAVYEAELDAGRVVFRIGSAPEGPAPQQPLAILTGWNPGYERPGDGFNRRANERLAAELEKRGYRYVPAHGRTEDDTHNEPSLAALGIPLEEAAELGRMFRQAAFFYWDRVTARILPCDPLLSREAAEEADARTVVIRLFNEVLNGGRVGALDNLLASNFHDHTPSAGQGSGTGGVGIKVAALRAAFPDLKFELEALIAEHDLVAARWHAKGTHQGALGDIAPTGQRVMMRGMDFYRVEFGRIAEHWDCTDQLGLLTQLGAVHMD